MKFRIAAILLALTIQAQAGERPSGCPHAWCGCFLMRHFGLSDRSLWRAAEWARKFPRTVASIGSVVVWRHHVGVITGEGSRPHEWKVLSGNDGRAVRERLRNTSNAIAFVQAR